MTAHGIGQPGPQPLDPFFLRRTEVGDEAERPVARHNRLATIQRQYQGGGGRQLPDRREDGAGRRNIVIRQVITQRVPVQITRHVGVFQYALDLGGEEEAPPVPGVHQRLDARPVARQEETAGPLVEDGEGEHSP